MKHLSTFLLALLVAALLVFALTRCATPEDAQRADAASGRYVETVNEATAKYQRGETDLAAWKAEVAVARAQLKADMAEIGNDIAQRTKNLGGVLGGATDPLALVLTGAGSIFASIFGTNYMRDKTRAAQLAQVHSSIAETDQWVAEVEAKATPKA